MADGRLPDPDAAVTPATLGTGRLPAPGTLGRLPAPAEPALNPTPWGFVKNLVSGVGAAVKGISDLVGMAMHDVIGTAQRAIPGEQRIEGEIEEEGYLGARMARTLLPGAWVPGADLGGKYGALASDYAQRYGGLSNILEGLYQDPVSYISDALIVADGVGLVAKAGRVGSVGSVLPKLVSDPVAAKILGPAARVEEATGRITGVSRYGTRPVASLEAGGEALKLSQYPLRRWAQNKFYDAITLAPDEAAELAKFNTARATAVINGAQNAGLRILRPGVSKFVAGRESSKILSAIRVNKNVLSAEAVADLKKIMPKELDGDIIGLYKQNLATPLEIPDTSPFELRTDLAKLDFENAPQVGPVNPADAQAVAKTFGKQESSLIPPEAPGVAAGGATGKLNRYQIEVGSADDADLAARRAFEAVDADPIGVVDGFADVSSPWAGARFFGRKRSDGSIIEFSIADANTLRAQAAAATVLPWLTKKSEELSSEMARLADIPEGNPAAVAIASRIELLKTELKATRESMDGLFDDARAQYWADHGGPAYDPHLKAAWVSRAWDQLNITKRWLDTGRGSYTTQMERAYGMQRIFQLEEKLKSFENEYSSILNVHPMELTTQQKAVMVATYLKDRGIPSAIIDQIVARFPGRLSPRLGTALLKRRTRDALWDLLAQEGGHSAAFTREFADFDWRVMHDARKASGLPTATYMPHFADANASDYISSKGPSLMRPNRPGITKNWAGLLFERGFVSMDARAAGERAARIMINHQELNELIDNMIGKFGRKLTPDEVSEASMYGNPRYRGEVFTSPQKVRTDLDARSKFMTDTVLGVGDGDVLDTSTMNALDGLSTRIFEDGVNNLVGGEVYAIPKSVARQLEKEAALQLGHSVRLFWDTPMSLWKASVLSLSPRWVLNNFFGNLIFLGLENPGALRFAVSQMNRKNRALMEYLLGPDVLETVESGFYRNPAGAKIVDPDTKLMSAVNKGTAPLQWVSGKVTRMQSMVEEAARRGTLLNAAQRSNLMDWTQGFHSSYAILERLWREGSDKTLFNDAVKSVDRTLGNFMRYSPVEQGIIRRFISPFYGFYRHAANVFLRLPFEHPFKTRALQLVHQFSEDYEASLPEYMKDQAAVYLGQIGGKDTVARFANWNPLNNFVPVTGGPGPAISLLNPAIKVMIERQLGIDSFTGEPFKTPDDMVQTNDGTYWQVVRDGAGNVIGVERTGRPLPSLLNHVGGQFGLLNMAPPFQRYPKAMTLQLASYLGIPVSQPKTNLAASIQFEQDMEKQAMASAVGGSDPFASAFAAFPSSF